MYCQDRYNVMYTKFYHFYKEEKYMELNAIIGTKIAVLRKLHGLTQEQLAEKLDISIKHCSSVERGLSCFSLEKLIEISDLFDVSLDYLIKERPTKSISRECVCDNLPPTIVNIMRSGNETEIKLLNEYLHLYGKLRKLPQ